MFSVQLNLENNKSEAMIDGTICAFKKNDTITICAMENVTK